MGKTRKNLTGWPEGWNGEVVDFDLAAYATARGLSYAEEFEAFRDYHQAHGSRFADWTAAFRTWCRNAQKYAAEKAGHPLWEIPVRGGPRPIGFTVPHTATSTTAIDPEYEREIMNQTPEQRAANVARLREIIGSIKVK